MKKLLTFIALACLLLSKPAFVAQTAENAGWNSIGDKVFAANCPYMTSDLKGNLVISWVKEINDTMAYVCYAVSPDKGRTFGKPVEIIPSVNVNPQGENMPKLIFKPNGEIIAMWGESNPNPNSKYSGLVYYSQSFDNGKSWSKVISLVKDSTAYDHRYFDVEMLPGGEAAVIWLDNRGKKKKEGSTLFFAVTEGKKGFTKERVIGETCCQCCRTDLFIDSKGNVHASYRDIINDSIRDMVHQVSMDGGNKFSAPVRISHDNWVIRGCPHTGPASAENKKGLHFSWYTLGGGEGVFYCKSPDFGKTFSKREIVSSHSSAKHPQLTTLADGRIVIVWDESIRKGDKVNSRIGMQVRDENGKVISSKFISGDDAVCEYPVIKTVSGNNVFVAFTKRLNGNASIQYKTLAL